MLSSGLGLVLAPGLPAVAALLAYAMPGRLARAAQLTGLLGVAACLAVLGVDAALVAGGGRVQASLGGEIGGVALLLRSDPIGVVVATAAAVAGALALAGQRWRRHQVVGILVCLTGSVVAALAGDAVTLFAGAEVASLGTLVMLMAPRRRVGRGLLAALALEHISAVGLLAAAALLVVAQGTSAFAALPTGAVTAAVAWPWAVAGAIRIIAPGFVPARGTGVPTGAWAAVGAVPCAAAILLRLREAASGAPLPAPVLVTLAAFGGVVAIAGAAAAIRYRGSPALAGRGLAVVAAAPVVALTGFSGAAATGVAAGLCALELCVAASPAWERPARHGGAWLAAAALLMAGGLPLGFGTSALVLELGSVAALRRAGLALLVSLLIAAAGAAAAAVTVARTVFRTERAHVLPAPLAAAAVLVSAVAALLPGGVATTVNLLASGGASRPAGVAAVLGPGGGWAGGYFVVAVLFLVIAGGAALRLGGVALPAPTSRAAEPRGGRVPVAGWRAARQPVQLLLLAGAAVDDWLLVQPQLPLLVGGSLLALLLIH